MNIKEYMRNLGINARKASHAMANLETKRKNVALINIAEQLNVNRPLLLEANQRDIEEGRTSGLTAALLDRLGLSDQGIDQMIQGLQQVAALPDPCGEVSDLRYCPSGIQVGKMRAPLGVVGIIYESRPNVTVDAASLCLKSGNATILRGGKEALHSNQAIARCIHQGLEQADLPPAAVQVIDTPDRDVVSELITMNDYVDVIVPRGVRA